MMNQIYFYFFPLIIVKKYNIINIKTKGDTMDIIKIENLDFNFENRVLFNKLNLKITDKSWYCLLGNNGSGKTTLIKIILGLIKTDSVFINNVSLNEETKYDLRKYVGCVFENPNNNLICEKIEEELSFPLENMGLSEKEIEIRIQNIMKIFGFSKKLDVSINDLTIDEKQTLSIMVALITGPQILILDEAFTFMNKAKKYKILEILKKLDITIISVTHDIEELMFADNIILLKNGKILANDKKENIFEKELLKNIPFIVDLSMKLKYYDLVQDISYSYKELVNKIWN